MMWNKVLGKIPIDWKIKKIDEICNVFGGGTPSTKNFDFWEGKINWIVPSDLTKSKKIFIDKSERKITSKGLENCSSKLHSINTILMTSRATIGHIAINKVPVATNQGFIVVEPNRKNMLYYLFNNLISRISEFIENANGTTFLEISRGVFRKLPILLPSDKILTSFQQIVGPLYDMIYTNEIEIQKLKLLRDNLLPKLMSGQIRV